MDRVEILATNEATKDTPMGKLATIARKYKEKSSQSKREAVNELKTWAHEHTRNRWLESPPDNLFIAYTFGKRKIEILSALIDVQINKGKNTVDLWLKPLAKFRSVRADPEIHPLPVLTAEEEKKRNVDLTERHKIYYPTTKVNKVKILHSGITKLQQNREIIDDPIYSIPFEQITIHAVWSRHLHEGRYSGTSPVKNTILNTLSSFSAVIEFWNLTLRTGDNESKRTPLSELYTGTDDPYLISSPNGNMSLWGNVIRKSIREDENIGWCGIIEGIYAASFPGNPETIYESVYNSGKAEKAKLSTVFINALVPVYNTTGLRPPELYPGTETTTTTGSMTENDTNIHDPLTDVYFDGLFEPHYNLRRHSDEFDAAKRATSAMRLRLKEAILNNKLTPQESLASEAIRALLVASRLVWATGNVKETFDLTLKSTKINFGNISYKTASQTQLGALIIPVIERQTINPLKPEVSPLKSIFGEKDIVVPISPPPSPLPAVVVPTVVPDVTVIPPQPTTPPPAVVVPDVTVIPTQPTPPSPAVVVPDVTVIPTQPTPPSPAVVVPDVTVIPTQPTPPSPAIVVPDVTVIPPQPIIPITPPPVPKAKIIDIVPGDEEDELIEAFRIPFIVPSTFGMGVQQAKITSIPYSDAAIIHFTPKGEYRKLDANSSGRIYSAIQQSITSNGIMGFDTVKRFSAVGFVFSTMHPFGPKKHAPLGRKPSIVRLLQQPVSSINLGLMEQMVLGLDPSKASRLRKSNANIVLGWADSVMHRGKWSRRVGNRPNLIEFDETTQAYDKAVVTNEIKIPAFSYLSIKIFPKDTSKPPFLISPIGSLITYGQIMGYGLAYIRDITNPNNIIGVCGGMFGEAGIISLKFLFLTVFIPE